MDHQLQQIASYDLDVRVYPPQWVKIAAYPSPTPTPTPTPPYCEPIGAGTTNAPQSAKSDVCQVRPSEEGFGLRGDYFDGAFFDAFVDTRYDAQVDFVWSDAPIEGAPADHFSVIWSGQIRINRNGDYQFCTDSDDGIVLSIDGNVVIDQWTEHPETRHCATVWLHSDPSMHDLQLEYYDATGQGIARLWWQPPGQSLQLVPMSVLYPVQVPPVPPVPIPEDLPNGARPLTTARLREIAEQYPEVIWGTRPVPARTDPMWYFDIGRSFEGTVLQLLSFFKSNNSNIPTPLREQKPNGRPSTRPDGLGDLTISGDTILFFPESNILEVKAKRGGISLSDSRYQMSGMIEIASNSLSGIANGTAMLTLITTSDTRIGTSVLTEATNAGIIVCHSFMYEISEANGNKYWVGEPTWLNRDALVPILLMNGIDRATCSPLSSSVSSWTPLQTEFDPTDPDPSKLDNGTPEG